MPLAQAIDRRAGRDRGAPAPCATARIACAGTTSRIASARAASCEVAWSPRCGVERTPGRNAAFALLLRAASAFAGVVRPQRDLAAGARGDVGERRAPGAAAEHRDALERSCAGALCDAGAGLQSRPGDLVQRPARARREVERIGRGPSASRSAPAQAIMAPLSVQSSSGGATSVMPRLEGDALQHLADRLLAATPPATTSAVGVP